MKGYIFWLAISANFGIFDQLERNQFYLSRTFKGRYGLKVLCKTETPVFNWSTSPSNQLTPIFSRQPIFAPEELVTWKLE